MKRKENIIAAIIDYNVGNVNSVKNAIERVGYRAVITKDPVILEQCSHIILPGVGAFDEASQQLKKSGILLFLEDQVFRIKKPILGICVGMQLMFEWSYENGIHEGLGWVKGEVRSLEVPSNFNLPHVGWNDIEIVENKLFQMLDPRPVFYFDHTYECRVEEDVVIATTRYPEIVHSAINKENIYAVQFHPEKSQVHGLRIFKSFLELC